MVCVTLTVYSEIGWNANEDTIPSPVAMVWYGMVYPDQGYFRGNIHVLTSQHQLSTRYVCMVGVIR